MTKLEELINELCPDGVEYVKIKDYFIRLKGTSITAAKMKEIASNDGEIKVFAGGKTVINAYEKDIPKANITRVPAVLVQSRGVIDVVYYDNPFTFKNEMWAYTHNEQTTVKYLYYFLSTQVNKMRESASGMGSLPQISLKVTEEMQIPLPPLSIQSEIVHILDSFTSLTAELTAELTARQKQYAFYRDYLLDFSNEDVTKKIPDIDCSNVEYKRLGNIAIIERGKRVVRNDLSQEIGYPVYQNALKPLGYYTDKNRNANSVFVIGAGAAGEIGYSYVDYWAADDCFTFVCDDKLNQRYLYFLLMSKQAYLKNNVRKSSIPRLPRIALENMEIPVPPLSVQENIVKILDRFDKLNNDMSEGLPAEIEARKKQYEYYRDTLLSFDDKACSHIVKVERERELTRIKAIKWLSIQDLFNLRNGYTPSKSKSEYWTNGTIPWFRMEDIRENGHILNDSIQHITPIAVKGNLFPANSIILATSATIGEHALITVDSLANQRFTYFTAKNEYSNQLNMKYVFYYFFKIDEWCKNNLNVSSFASVDMDKFKKLKFPIPPLEEQERIVSILDRFDKLCNDISEGLPAEIEARQKQYEYYRDKLLSFKEKNHA